MFKLIRIIGGIGISGPYKTPSKSKSDGSLFARCHRVLLLQHFNQCRHFPHVGNGAFFQGDEVFGVEGSGHDEWRILYLGVVAKEKATPHFVSG